LGSALKRAFHRLVGFLEVVVALVGLLLAFLVVRVLWL
jgi:hypothetical protein